MHFSTRSLVPASTSFLEKTPADEAKQSFFPLRSAEKEFSFTEEDGLSEK
jgi:hypothetical protein